MAADLFRHADRQTYLLVVLDGGVCTQAEQHFDSFRFANSGNNVQGSVAS